VRHPLHLALPVACLLAGGPVLAQEVTLGGLIEDGFELSAAGHQSNMDVLYFTSDGAAYRCAVGFIVGAAESRASTPCDAVAATDATMAYEQELVEREKQAQVAAAGQIAALVTQRYPDASDDLKIALSAIYAANDAGENLKPAFRAISPEGWTALFRQAFVINDCTIGGGAEGFEDKFDAALADLFQISVADIDNLRPDLLSGLEPVFYEFSENGQIARGESSITLKDCNT